MNSVDICNLALNQLKARNILSLGENSEEAAQVSRVYGFGLKQLLRRFPWGFARRISPLALTDYRLPGYRYLYRYPDDCLFVRRVYNDARSKGGWDVLSVAQATDVLATDMEGAYLDYTYDLRDTGVFPPDFTQALVYYLAALLAPALSADAGAQGSNYELFQSAYLLAAGADSNEDKDSLPWESRILRARL